MTTKVDSLNAVTYSGARSQQQMRILFAVENNPGLSRSELSEITGLRLSSVCARVNELVCAGLLEDGQVKRCSITKRTVHAVRTNKNNNEAA